MAYLGDNTSTGGLALSYFRNVKLSVGSIVENQARRERAVTIAVSNYMWPVAVWAKPIVFAFDVINTRFKIRMR